MKTKKMDSNFGSATHVRAYRDELVAEAKTLLSTADAEKRALTAEEELSHDELLSEIKRTSDALAKIDERTSTLRVLESLATRGGLPRPGGSGDSVGSQLVRSEPFAEFRSRLGSGFPSAMVPLEVRAPLLSPSGGWPATVAAPSTMAPLPPWGEVRVSSLFTTLPAEGSQVPYLRDPGQTSAAAPVAEGDPKPETTVSPTLVSEPLSTIAHWSPVSVQSLEDVEGLRAWIDSILLTGLADVEETQLLTGNGTPPNLRGLLNVTGLTAAHAMTGEETAADAILAQMMAVQTASRLPVDAVILAPDAFTALVTTKADTSGVYLSGQPLATAPLSTLWGMRYVISAALDPGTALVGSFRRAAAIYRRGAIRIDASNSHADYFVKNLVAIRAEMRELLAVFKPSAFGLVTELVPAAP